MKLLYASTSPYSAKVRMAARHVGIEIDAVPTKTDDAPAELLTSNPLGKIPVLIRDDGKPAVYDSVAIMQFLNRESKSQLYPRNPERRTDAEILEALCDGITDCLLAIVYEKRFHPPEKIHQPWIDKQWAKVVRGLDHLSIQPPGLMKLHGGHFAMAAMLGYLELRFAGEWEKDRSKLQAWVKRFERAFPDYQQLKPQTPAA